jgi:hypothetical protein
MLKNLIYYRTTFFNCVKIVLACSDQGGIENTKNEWMIRETHKIFIEKSERNFFGSSRRIWEDNIKMDHKDEDVRKWTTFKWLKIKTNGEICDNSNEFKVFIQRDEV